MSEKELLLKTIASLNQALTDLKHLFKNTQDEELLAELEFAMKEVGSLINVLVFKFSDLTQKAKRP